MATGWRKSLLAAAVAVSLGAPVAARAAADAGDAALFYEDALRRHAEGDDRGAIIQLKNVLQRDPRHIAALMLKGRIHLARREPEEAIRTLEKARELGADEALVVYPLGEAYLMEGRYDDVLTRFAPKPASREASRDVHVLHGFAYLAKRDLDAAEAAFRRAASLVPAIETPRDAAPVRGLARVALQRGHPGAARRLLAPLRDRKLRDADLWFLLAETSRSEGRIDDAIGELATAISIDPGLYQARLTRAALLITRGREKAALEEVRGVLERIPDQAEALYLEIVIDLRTGDRAAMKAAVERATQALSRIDQDTLRGDRSALLLAGFVNFVEGNESEAETYLSRHLALAPGNVYARKLLARIYLQRRSPKDAIIVLQPVMSVPRPDAEALTLLGDAYLKTDQYALASAALERAVAAAPDRGRLLGMLAVSRLAAGQVEEAAADLESHVAKHPEDGRAAFMLGHLYLQERRFGEAARLARGLTRRFPDNPMGFTLLGAALLNSGDAAAARASLERALALDPQFIPARLNLGKLEDHVGHRDTARGHFLQALRQRPTEARAMLELARLAEKDGDYRAAVSWLEKVVRLEEKTIEPMLDLARLNLLANRPDEALTAVLDARKIAPADPNVLEMLARVHLARSEIDRAREALRWLAAESQRDPHRLARVAALQQKALDPESARKSLRRAIEVAPDDLAVQAAWLGLLYKEGRFGEAVAHARKLADAHRDSAEAGILLGDALYRAGHYSEAAQRYAAAMHRQPSGSLAVRRYLALKRLGRVAEGVAGLEAWARANPEDRAASRALGRALAETGRTREAAALYEPLAASLPEDADVKNDLAVLYGRLGDPRALAVAAEAHALAPGKAIVLDTYGWLLASSGEAEQGLSLLRDAHVRDPRNPEIGYHLAAVLARRGSADEARRLLKDVLSSDRPFYGIDEARKLFGDLARR